jgi:hypothetical protein
MTYVPPPQSAPTPPTNTSEDSALDHSIKLVRELGYRGSLSSRHLAFEVAFRELNAASDATTPKFRNAAERICAARGQSKQLNADVVRAAVILRPSLSSRVIDPIFRAAAPVGTWVKEGTLAIKDAIAKPMTDQFGSTGAFAGAVLGIPWSLIGSGGALVELMDPLVARDRGEAAKEFVRHPPDLKKMLVEIVTTRADAAAFEAQGAVIAHLNGRYAEDAALFVVPMLDPRSGLVAFRVTIREPGKEPRVEELTHRFELTTLDAAAWREFDFRSDLPLVRGADVERVRRELLDFQRHF